MHAATINLKGATREGTAKITSTISEADLKTRALLQTAVRSNHEDVEYLLLRDGTWYSFNWDRLQRQLLRGQTPILEQIPKLIFSSLIYGILAPLLILEICRYFSLSFMRPFFHFGLMPYLVAAVTFLLTRAFYRWKVWHDEHKKFGVAYAFLDTLPPGHLYRGWAATERALYMVEGDNDGRKCEVKRVPWSEMSSCVFVVEDWYAAIRVFDHRGEFLQGIVAPREDGGARIPDIANFMRKKINEHAILYR